MTHELKDQINRVLQSSDLSDEEFYSSFDDVCILVNNELNKIKKDDVEIDKFNLEMANLCM